MSKTWIAGATKNKGGLHRSLSVPEGKKIPVSKLNAAARGEYGEKAQKQAQLAKTLRKMKKSEEDD